MEAKTHEFEFEGKKYKFREAKLGELQDFAEFLDIEDIDKTDLKKSIPMVIKYGNFLTKLSADNTNYNDMRPIEFQRFMMDSFKFLICELMGGTSSGELKMDLTQIQKEMIHK